MRVSVGPKAQNAEVVQAVDGQYIYEEWDRLCNSGIGFARSVDGGKTFGPSTIVRGSRGAHVWDPALAGVTRRKPSTPRT